MEIIAMADGEQRHVLTSRCQILMKLSASAKNSLRCGHTNSQIIRTIKFRKAKPLRDRLKQLDSLWMWKHCCGFSAKQSACRCKWQRKFNSKVKSAQFSYSARGVTSLIFTFMQPTVVIIIVNPLSHAVKMYTRAHRNTSKGTPQEWSDEEGRCCGFNVSQTRRQLCVLLST